MTQVPALAGLCAVVLGVPLAVLGPAAGPYDDPKAWALAILVALAAVAWLIDRARDRGAARPAGGLRATWPLAVVAAYGLWWVVTTLTGLAPGQSLLGNFGRGLGLVAFGAAILMFAVAWSACRSPAAVGTVVDAALVGSAPVCLLALGQAVGWDPLPPAWDPAVRSLAVRSTFGQHIFLGSYLVALIPLAVARVVWAVHERDVTARAPGRSTVAAAVWVAGAVALVALAGTWDLAWWLLAPWGALGAAALGSALARAGAVPALPLPVVLGLLVGQVLVVVLSQARGAFLGMLAGLGVVAFGLLARRRAWRALAVGAAALAGLVLFLALLNTRGSPLEPLRSAPLLGRLARLSDVTPGTPGWVRLQIWRGTLDGWQRQLGGEVLIPAGSPRARSLVGYGLETQLVTLDRLALPWLGHLRARGVGWNARYIVDRAHNVLLDHLVTGGLVGVVLWLAVIGAVVGVGVARARAAATGPEAAMRIGALGVIAAHVVEGQVGIATPMPLALFWLAAALCALPPASPPPPPVAGPRRVPAARVAAAVGMALIALAVAWAQTRWLLASVAYAEGVKHAIASRPAPAHQSFLRSARLMPWLGLPVEGAASTALLLAGAETEAGRRRSILRQAEALLAGVRGRAATGAPYWTLSAQVAFGLVRAGDRDRIATALEAFEHAARLRPWDGPLLTQWAWALLEAGEPARARDTARKAVAEAPEDVWLAWAVLARSARDLGHRAEAEGAAMRARRLAPPGASAVLEDLIPG